MPRKVVTNWGNYPVIEADVTAVSARSDIAKLIGDKDHLIARGNGRSYGDASLGSNIFSALRFNKFLAFDGEKGTIECESGVLLSDILDVIVPKGFFLPVTPGTKFITVGGAIAADVHGKNHHVDGSFASHIEHFELMNGNGDVIRCSPDENELLFWQTCGGMGLTGIILSAKFRLRRIETAFISHISLKTRDIESTMKAFEIASGSTYSVAWLDCFGTSKSLGQSILQLGEHAPIDDVPDGLRSEPLRPSTGAKAAVPFYFPSFTLNRLSVTVFNTAYYHRQMREETRSIIHFDSFFYPLDGVRDWNRVYGRGGFVQYQFVLPLEQSFDGLVKVLEKVRRSGQGSPLAVLKLFGENDPRSIMSFPMKGYTLALDFKVNNQVFKLLDELDDIVAEHQGRIYLAKDARMSAKFFKESYKERISSGYFRSAQSSRLEY